MDKPKAYCRLLLPCFLVLSACTVDISQPDSSATVVNAEAKTWAVKFQHQSSFTEQSIKEITEPDLKPGDLLFSSSLGVTSFGIRVFSTSSVSHVAIYLGDNNVAEATGAGVQIVSLKKAIKHSDTQSRRCNTTASESVIIVIAVSCVKLLFAHNFTQHTSRTHKM